jgi:hypothetical protein
MSEICIQISDTLNGGIVSEAAERTNREQVTESGFHAAVTSQLRIPSLTPSQHFLDILLEQQLTASRFPSEIPASRLD